MPIDSEEARRTSAYQTNQYIAGLEQEIERLKRHNAIYHPDYDLERDELLDVAWEAGRRAAWVDTANHLLEKITGPDVESRKVIIRMERELADIDLELRELWAAVEEKEPFPAGANRADTLKRVRRLMGDAIGKQERSQE